MLKNRTAILVCAAASLLGFLLTAGAQAQDAFPSKPIRIIVPYPPGGVADQLARVVQKPMEEVLKQPVIVENVIGAGGAIGTAAVARSPRDGYTLLMANTGPISVSPLVSKTGYDPLKDLVPVSMLAQGPMLLVVQASNTSKTLAEFIAAARASGTSWNFGSAGPASLSHLTGEYFNSAAGTRLVHVPYNGGSRMAAAFMGGDLQAAFVTGPDSTAMLQSGKLRYLAVASAQRSESAPGLPTLAETLPGFTSEVWHGILAPAGIPEPVARRLHEAISYALVQPETQRPFAGRYLEVKGSTPAELSRRIRGELDHWARVIKDANIDLK